MAGTDRLIVTAYNIPPDGSPEAKAVETVYERISEEKGGDP